MPHLSKTKIIIICLSTVFLLLLTHIYADRYAIITPASAIIGHSQSADKATPPQKSDLSLMPTDSQSTLVNTVSSGVQNDPTTIDSIVPKISDHTHFNEEFTNDVALLAKTRPNVLHVLQGKFVNVDRQQTAIQGAALLQRHLIQPTLAGNVVLHHYDCLTLSLTQSDQTLIKHLIFDTSKRQQKLRQSIFSDNSSLVTQIEINDTGNAVSPCQNEIYNAT